MVRPRAAGCDQLIVKFARHGQIRQAVAVHVSHLLSAVPVFGAAKTMRQGFHARPRRHRLADQITCSTHVIVNLRQMSKIRLDAFLGIDVGTTGVRCLVVDETGRVLSEATADYPLYSPHPGWSEQRPEEWWEATRKAVVEVARAAGPHVGGIGLTGQMHGAVFLDANDRVIRPALLWNDQRTAAQCETITRLVGAERLAEITGNPALTGFQAPKVIWFREEEPRSYERLRRLLLPKDYVRLQLTGDSATDASDASGTLLFDIRKRNWSAEILDALEIPSGWLPAVFEGPEPAGALRADLARELGLPAGIPVAAGAGDNAGAAIGNGIIAEGLASCSIGTSGVLFSHSEELVRDATGRIHAFCHAVPARYHLMGVTLAAGGALSWWRDVVHAGDYEDLGQLAGGVPPGSEGLVFLPYLSGERSPHLDPLARGAFFGLSSRHGAAHLTRAVMEGVAFSLRDSFEIMAGLGVAIAEIRVTGGGAKSALWRQMLADILGCRIVRTTADQGPAYGAALLAGVAAGMYPDVERACDRIGVRPDANEPDPATASIYDDYYSSYRDLYPATVSAMHKLSGLASRARPLI